MELNERIVQLRKQAGLTQEQLGEKLGVSRQAVSKWESGQANPDVVYVAEICKLFEVSSDWLLLGKEKSAVLDPARCAECGAALPAGAEFCPRCGIPLGVGDGYCLYLTGCSNELSWGLAGRVKELFEQPWATPAFPWNGKPIDQDAAWNIVRSAPIVLCKGLTREQAERGFACFQYDSYPEFIEIHHESDMAKDKLGNFYPLGAPFLTPEAPPHRESAREPLSGGAIFGLVVLGVIAAIVIMSIF